MLCCGAQNILGKELVAQVFAPLLNQFLEHKVEPIPVEAQALARRVRRWTDHMERAGGCVQDWDQEGRSRAAMGTDSPRAPQLLFHLRILLLHKALLSMCLL